MDSCSKVPKFVYKYQLLACKPRLQLGEMLRLRYPLNYAHSPPTMAQTSCEDVGMHTPTFDFLCLIQASNQPWKLIPPNRHHFSTFLRMGPNYAPTANSQIFTNFLLVYNKENAPLPLYGNLWDSILLLWNSFPAARFWKIQHANLHYIIMIILPIL